MAEVVFQVKEVELGLKYPAVLNTLIVTHHIAWQSLLFSACFLAGLFLFTSTQNVMIFIWNKYTVLILKTSWEVFQFNLSCHFDPSHCVDNESLSVVSAKNRFVIVTVGYTPKAFVVSSNLFVLLKIFYLCQWTDKIDQTQHNTCTVLEQPLHSTWFLYVVGCQTSSCCVIMVDEVHSKCLPDCCKCQNFSWEARRLLSFQFFSKQTLSWRPVHSTRKHDPTWAGLREVQEM